MSQVSSVRGPRDPRMVTAVLAADVGPISSTTTLQDITGLFLPIGGASTERWIVEVTLLVTGSTVMDLKLGWSVPASCTMVWNSVQGLLGQQALATPIATTQTEGTTIAVAADTSFLTGLRALVKSGGTAGKVQMRFAQNTSDAGNLTIKAGSCLVARRLLN